MRKFIFILFLQLIPVLLFSQQEKDTVVKGIITNVTVFEGDTIPYISLPVIYIYADKYRMSESERIAYDKLVRNVKKVYPYACLAGMKLREYNDILMKAPDKGERRRIMKKAEQEIKDQFGTELKQLTFSQGKILIKLLYRETGNTSYELVQELRGKFVAFFYQAFARLFGYNLKSTYDPEGEDRLIEIIVLQIQKGLI
ncbi:MAG: DUF4294 domain-containing protein [Bacteroidetes bacterium]|nr:DUF4294 domain-containing protein [Bacteroidota bacterium]